MEYSLSRTSFNCKDIGERVVEVNAVDANGNSSSASARVNVIDGGGVCGDTIDGSEYIFVYPNPNQGSFKVATPGEVQIERIEVFDHRGRFINARDYDSNDSEYSMDLGPLQEAVYVLKIITNERTVTKRFIFKN